MSRVEKRWHEITPPEPNPFLIEQTKTMTESWAIIYKRLNIIEELLQECLNILQNRKITHILLYKSQISLLEYIFENETLYVLEESKVYIFKNNEWVFLKDIPDYTNIINDIDELKKNKDIIEDLSSSLDNEIDLTLKIKTDKDVFETTTSLFLN